jgi:hypothetical protein
MALDMVEQQPKGVSMKSSFLRTTLLYAAATFAIASAVVWPAATQATDDAGTIAATIARPKLAASGCEATLVPTGLPDGQAAFAAGDRPQFDLVVHNPTDASVELPYKVTILSTPSLSPMSRSMPMPKTVWEKGGTLAVAPHQSATVHLQSDVVLASTAPAQSQVAGNVPPMIAGRTYVNLQSGDKAVRAMEFATAGPGQNSVTVGNTVANRVATAR